MKSRPNSILPTFLVSTFMITACTVYYNTTDIKKTFSTAKKESDKTIESIEKDRSEKLAIYNQLLSKLADSTLTPYPALATNLEEMSQLLNKLKHKSTELEDLNARFIKLSKGHKKIESNSPLWENYQSIKTEYEKQTDQFQILANSYTECANSFVATINKNKISNINVPDLRNQVSTYLEGLEKNVAELKRNIEANQKILEQQEVQGNSPSKLAAKSRTLGELSTILIAVTAKQTELRQLVGEFEKEVGEEPVIWSGPGLLTQTILQDMERIGVEIERAGQKFNTLAKKL